MSATQIFGRDSLNWSDDVHFCYFANHGGNANNNFLIGFTAQHDNCIGSSDTWRLGVKSLKWVVFDACDLVLDTNVGSIVEWSGRRRASTWCSGSSVSATTTAVAARTSATTRPPERSCRARGLPTQ
ncbi:MAG: DUF6345 domain-containing protein [Solirubrobacteraceae bacterium]